MTRSATIARQDGLLQEYCNGNRQLVGARPDGLQQEYCNGNQQLVGARPDGRLQEYCDGNQQLVGAGPDGRCLYKYQSECHVPNEQELSERHATVSIQRLAAEVFWDRRGADPGLGRASDHMPV